MGISCGLTRQRDIPAETNNRKILAQITNKENIKIVATKPLEWRSQFDNTLRWPHDNQNKVKNTYKKINNLIAGYGIYGFVCFLNGAFFCNKRPNK